MRNARPPPSRRRPMLPPTKLARISAVFSRGSTRLTVVRRRLRQIRPRPRCGQPLSRTSRHCQRRLRRPVTRVTATLRLSFPGPATAAMRSDILPAESPRRNRTSTIRRSAITSRPSTRIPPTSMLITTSVWPPTISVAGNNRFHPTKSPSPSSPNPSIPAITLPSPSSRLVTRWIPRRNSSKS